MRFDKRAIDVKVESAILIKTKENVWKPMNDYYSNWYVQRSCNDTFKETISYYQQQSKLNIISEFFKNR